jgi:hypothetical protein
MAKEIGIPDERRKALYIRHGVWADFLKALESWPTSRARRSILLRLAALLVVTVNSFLGLGPSLIQSGPVGMLLQIGIVSAGASAIFMGGEVITWRAPYWSYGGTFLLFGLIAVFLFAVPASSSAYDYGVRLLSTVVFGWPILGVPKALRDIDESRKLLALSSYLKSIPRNERLDTMQVLTDRAGNWYVDASGH